MKKSPVKLGILSFIHYVHYGDLYSAPSRLLIRSAPDPCTAKQKSFEARVNARQRRGPRFFMREFLKTVMLDPSLKSRLGLMHEFSRFSKIKTFATKKIKIVQK